MNYEKLGLKIGFEIHQQLSTKKLFCNCPSILREDEPNLKIERNLRAVAGESGKVDIATLYEMQKKLNFIYEYYNDTNCLVELDDEPPHNINKNALNTVLQITLLLNAEILDEIQVMRKAIIDGSNTSGFQRTMLIARNGYLETKQGKVRIEEIFLEEDAARKIKIKDDVVVYRLDRLGIPLIEIKTYADIKTPEQAVEVAEKLGMIFRSTNKVRRGIGTIRQDINISIKNGDRVELKGFQDLRSMKKVIDNEVSRQLNLVKQNKKVKQEVRKVNQDTTTDFLRPMPGAARMYPETDIPTIKITKEMLENVELPELLTEITLSLEKKYEIDPSLLRTLLKKKQINEFEYFTKKFKSIKQAFIAETLVSYHREILSEKGDLFRINKNNLEIIFRVLNENKISKDSVMQILIDISKGKKLDLKNYQITEINLEKEIKKLVSKNKDLSVNALMGIIMEKYKGKVDGSIVINILKRYYKKINEQKIFK